MLTIVDYGAGNLTSVARALNRVGIDCEISANPDALAKADGIIFPGVGQAGQAMANLRSLGLDMALAAALSRRQPLLGICLGCQILLEKSEEGPTHMLGLVHGDCARFEAGLKEEDGAPIKIPHIGWNSLIRKRDSPLLDGIAMDSEFYFVHSYYVRPQADLEIATTFYGREFCSFYGRDNFWAVQFHPEKSGEAGLRLLANFHSWCRHAL